MYQKNLYCQYKSKGEKRIANYLEERSIDFSYEKPVAIVDQGKTMLWHPDFFLNDYRIIIEYWGMSGDHKYDAMTARKKRVYTENKIDVIDIYPQDFKGNWKQKIDDGIYQTLENRLRSYCSESGYEQKKHFGSPVAAYQQLPFKFY